MDTDQKPITIKLGKPLISASPELRLNADLRPGKYRLQLVVTDKYGRTSQPCVQVFTVNSPVGLRAKFYYFIGRLFYRW